MASLPQDTPTQIACSCASVVGRLTRKFILIVPLLAGCIDISDTSFRQLCAAPLGYEFQLHESGDANAGSRRSFTREKVRESLNRVTSQVPEVREFMHSRRMRTTTVLCPVNSKFTFLNIAMHTFI